MSGNFAPSTPFEIYIYAKLESMTERLNALPCSEQSKRIGKCENEIANIKGKATIIGMLAGFISTLVTKYILGK